ncbi:hypothetical protein EV207_101185 [Scopulibacillus darangshiensis]|uniref:Uncharacterized protein n=1 Tax=Scopulibacillus darangshiensis TaxID=442528 RepID=A0A4R2PB55_9BACL|nr:hypothetical protein [Scopulibacillus darangshiensis]TCP32207.1 hypothetical protein EV207_101185 [Scopulibacillus darangshiensis]
MDLRERFKNEGEKDFDGTYFIATPEGDYVIYDPIDESFYIDDGDVREIDDEDEIELLI